MVMAPVIVVAPVAEVTDAARAVIGPDHPAAAVRVIIGIIIVRVVGRSIEEAPLKVMVTRESIAAVAKSAVAIAATVDDRAGSEAAIVKHWTTAAMKHRGATVKTSAAMEAAARKLA